MLQYILIAILLSFVIVVTYNIYSNKIILKGKSSVKLMQPICISILILCVFINYNLTELRPISFLTCFLALLLVAIITFSKEGVSSNGILFNGFLVKWKDINKISINEKDSRTILGYSSPYQKHKVMYFENTKRKELDKLIPKTNIYK